MKIAIIGASGFIGSAILKEALDRGHSVTAIVRHAEKITTISPLLTIKEADVTTADVASLVAGNEAVISAYNAYESATYVNAIKAIINGVRKAGIKRFLAVSGAGSLEIEPGLQLLDTPEFPAEWKGGASATRDAFYVIKEQDDLDWTVLSPAMMIEPGERTGKFRLGRDQVVADEKGDSRISTGDYAVAMIDELEKPAHIKQRFTLAY
ncbi:NAD(P)H-binding protein [Chitinophaga oryziterrae]|uniref:NAD(P)H-binding protein n=1 Tax=Chitinophaga oryziterrae TaxID=1031224 RepID=A0A6N8J732_9BACT|nr:NAD(P)-dependent oxidoreductase [Chitinophaga oryziterrae]MVT39992.1 NAD(P)H-binding protein [Chitinophaga oryziterrae]